MPDTGTFLWPTASNEAAALQDRQEFQCGRLTELANMDFESWAKESFEIATKIARTIRDTLKECRI
jgi:hypothetical protein